jgi:UDP-N-acetylmuramate dehydrogenase
LLERTVRLRLEQVAGKPGTDEATLDSHTSMGCGGPVAFLVEAQDSARLAAILEIAADEEIPWFVLGRGTNLLVADEGWPGLVITLGGALKECAVTGTAIDCGGGALLPKAAAMAAEEGLAGLEPLSRIPGSIGGAIAMNAGAWGSSIGELVEQVELCLPGETRVLERDDIGFSYRSSGLPAGSIVSRARLLLSESDPETVRAVTRDFQQRRAGSQPVGARTCGSVFKNPPQQSAGAMLDAAGCKGMREGDAEVSTMHANFIINTGGAKAADVVSLMDRCRRLVYESEGVVLEPEVRFLGEITLEPLP